VVRDPAAHRRVLEELFKNSAELGFGVIGLAASPLRGPAGNVEFLALLAHGAPPISAATAIERALAEAPPA
jgi:23S rRNA (cytidine1920-2'-O)/16S rRNA (cytidine1409-2'-O)-methyltransferase